MGLFDKIKGPVFFKSTSNASKQLICLQDLATTASPNSAAKIEQDIKTLQAGIYGEDTLAFELKNSRLPMIVLHDLYLEHEGLTVQIDYLIFTRKCCFILECKTLIGNIEVNSGGDFIRSFSCGGKLKREGIYSPITQNQRHLELLHQLRRQAKGNILT